MNEAMVTDLLERMIALEQRCRRLERRFEEHQHEYFMYSNGQSTWESTTIPARWNYQ